ncbi:hypothetical protein JG688_00008688, partial [Phytophthora aleatoria]
GALQRTTWLPRAYYDAHLTAIRTQTTPPRFNQCELLGRLWRRGYPVGDRCILPVVR